MEEFSNVTNIQNELSKYYLNVNSSKTELTILERSEKEKWNEVKKVGSLLGDHEDIKRRKHLSTVSLHKLNSIWIRHDKVKLSTRLHLYKALVKSVLTYNCGTWALTGKEEEKLDTYHRKQLRKILNIKYPTVISNKALYKKTSEIPLSLTILETRWRVFGHILRQPLNTPGNKAMLAYFETFEKKRKGRPKTSIVSTLRKDLKKAFNAELKLNNKNNLEQLRNVANNRNECKGLTAMI